MERVSRLSHRFANPCCSAATQRFVVLCSFMLLLALSGCSGERSREAAMNPPPEDVATDPTVSTTGPSDAMPYQPQAMPYQPEAVAVRPEAMSYSADTSGAASQAMVAPSPQVARSPQVAPSPQVASAQQVAPMMARSAVAPSPAVMDPPMATLPAGTRVLPGEGFATVQVFYATDRQRGSLPLSAIEVTGQQQTFLLLAGCAVCLLLVAAVQGLRGRTPSAAMAALLGGLSGCAGVALLATGQTNIEKHGVTYAVDRGTLARGICEVTVPNSHQRGQVERPSLLRFEIHEDQQKHIVLTSATELSESDFQQRLSSTVAASPAQDLLVFIHGYNVDFASAVQRTAQIAIDLPFEGVPVCYSWPSQGSLTGYTIDENNVEWTVTHLKEFLLELSNESGAKSINVVAHSMGNRAMTAALQQLQWQRPEETSPLFDRVVLAAPDVDADRFRRDLAPALLGIANQVTLYASSDDQALQASKQVHGYPRAGDGGANIVVVPGVETIDVSGIDLSLLGHSYYGDNESMLRELYEVIRVRLPAPQRNQLISRQSMAGIYWQLAQQPGTAAAAPALR